jgi:hypothetical protein
MNRHPTPAVWWQDSFLRGLLCAFVTSHILLAVLVPDGAARMLVGDRAGDRFRALTELLAQPNLDLALGVIFRIGSPGDWILFAPAFRLAGSYGVMAQNIAMYAFGIVMLYRLAMLLMPGHVAKLAAIAWALLPATIFHPHALVSEAICNPLLIALTYLLVRMELGGDYRWRNVVLAGVCAGVLAFVRHVYLLLPLATAVWFLVFRPHGLGPRTNVIAFLLLAFALTATWWVTIGLGAKRYELGQSVGGLESNLFLRADRMAVMGGLKLPPSYYDRNGRAGRELRTLQPAEFAGFAAAHPVLFAKTAVSDAFNLMANPGVAMLAGRYLGLFDLGERNHRDLNKWREARERDGPMGVVRLLWEQSRVGFAFNLAGSILWAAFLAVAAIGAWTFVRDARLTPATRVLLVGMAAYAIVLTSATAGYTRWDHRSGIEFILALWFALGVTAAVNWSGRRGSNARLPAPKAGALPG